MMFLCFKESFFIGHALSRVFISPAPLVSCLQMSIPTFIVLQQSFKTDYTRTMIRRAALYPCSPGQLLASCNHFLIYDKPFDHHKKSRKRGISDFSQDLINTTQRENQPTSKNRSRKKVKSPFVLKQQQAL
jgi:hypothetical protein